MLSNNKFSPSAGLKGNVFKYIEVKRESFYTIYKNQIKSTNNDLLCLNSKYIFFSKKIKTKRTLTKTGKGTGKAAAEAEKDRVR